MAPTTTAPRERQTLTQDLRLPKKASPIKVWAAIGAGFLILETFVLGAWLSSGPQRTPTGSEPVPGFMVAAGYTAMALGTIGSVAIVYYFVIRPWRRDKRFSNDGLLVFAFALLYWQDPLLNYTQVQFTWNSVFWNLGNWTSHVPGSIAPRAGMVSEPFIWMFPAYFYNVFLVVVVVNWFMRRVHERRPEISRLGLMACSFAFIAVLFTLIESVSLRLGLYAWPGTIGWLTVFKGEYYQFPLYEALFEAALFTGWASFRFFKDDRGNTFVERGIDELRISSRSRTGLRFLAYVAITNVVFLVCYNLPYQFVGMHQDTWPAEIVNRPYLTNGVCGPGTGYACPGPAVPIPRNDSARVGPDGTLVREER